MVIGLTGVAGSGKSTAAKYLVAAHGFTLVKFAGPLKQMMRCLGLTDREIEGDLKEQPCPILGGKSPRYAMQTIGTEWGRNIIHTELWVNVAVVGVHAVLDQGGKVVIDDCRFANEAKAIRECGGAIVQICRQGAGITGGHASEDQALAWDWQIDNDSSVENFQRGIDAVLWHLKEQRA